ncbi:uncharacterized protein LOC131041190 [Cryptomeria japonica]|uniref:uncharacterized protein LOC131041190 n=1 Tax=Cryptomeria japonica TaxID=3369 RepID=UPI0027DA20CD|nr:uncharacterized protein LOC131041190 [Cryptomeria japonica]
MVLQLADQSTAKPEGVLENITITIDTWDYPIDFLVLKARRKVSGYPIILGRLWLATTTELIDCRSGSMTISNGHKQKELTLYPPTKPTIHSNTHKWVDEDLGSKEDIIVELAMVTLTEHVEGYEDYVDKGEKFNTTKKPCEQIRENYFQKKRKIGGKTLNHHDQDTCPLNTLIKDPTKGENNTKEILLSANKPLFINSSLPIEQEKELKLTLEKHIEAFAWEYKDMRGICP